MADASFTPTTIIDQPVPMLTGNLSETFGNASDPVVSGSGASTPDSIPDNSIPASITAQELISESLNSETKKILGEFQFEQLGAIKIGQIQISPKGILGTDLSGNTTFSIDPDTGSATFKGTILASTLTGATINGGTIIGATIETATSGSRVVIGGSEVDVYDANGTFVGRLFASSVGFISLQAVNSNNVSISAPGQTINMLASNININSNIAFNGNITTTLVGNNGYIDLNSGHGDTTVTHHLDPQSANTYNLGGSSRYWFAINYHFLTKQGGFGHFDHGIAMQDDQILSPTEALLAMKPHQSQEEWGYPIYNFDTLPALIRVYPQDKKGNLIEKNEEGKYIDEFGEEHFEGEDVNAMISLLISAVRELTQRMKVVENGNNGQKRRI